MLKWFDHLLINFSVTECIEHSEAYEERGDNTLYVQLIIKIKIVLFHSRLIQFFKNSRIIF